ncbi:hypothetical protein [Dyella mobilis]|uniref:Molecular chaperone n=1 Tax=Dyella mobilis TaxID=1849582 RepID=A0ABS2KCX8_9GAMM|nr:hypothetical protein [Dyella mobilis]MBM7128680.1 hypothetical protein [Dyella mobilis]
MKRYVQFAIAMLIGMIDVVHADDSLRVTLSEPTKVADKQTGVVILTLTNDGSAPVEVLKWKSPFVAAGRALPNDLFVIKDANGAQVPYTGSFAKFVGMTADSFIHLGPGQSVSASVDLSKDYALKAGAYTVTYNQDLSAVPPKAGKTDAAPTPWLAGAHSVSNVLQIEISGSLLQGKKAYETNGGAFVNPADASSCGDNESVVTTALAEANTLANAGLTYEQNNWSNTMVNGQMVLVTGYPLLGMNTG